MQRQNLASSSSTTTLHFDAEGSIKPPIRFRTTTQALDPQQASKPQAIYIKAFDEIFTELDDDERKLLLTQINCFLEKNSDFEIFIDTPELNEDEADKEESMIQSCIKNTAKYLGKENYLNQLLMKKEKENIDINQFKENCKKRGIETLYLGGVFGRACVWSAARKMAENIYSKQLGDFHPNIRYVDSSLPFRFKNAVIWPELSEGYFYAATTFKQFIHFPEIEVPIKVNALEVPGILEKAEEKLRKFFPGRIGESYDDSLIEAEDREELEEFFFNSMQTLLIQETKKHSVSSNQSSLLSHPNLKEEKKEGANSDTTLQISQEKKQAGPSP